MSTSLLREYIQLMLEHPKGFDIRYFKTITDSQDVLIYAYENLQALGEGSARIVFKLSSKDVLKVALNKKGLAQNEAELDIFTNPASKPVVARIYDYDKNNNWLISELVKPLSRQTEFEKLSGIDFDDFMSNVEHNIHYSESLEDEQIPMSPQARRFVNATVTTLKVGDLMIGDIDNISHWGKTTDGRVVILDYGFTRNIYNVHYLQKPAVSSNPDAATKSPVGTDTKKD